MENMQSAAGERRMSAAILGLSLIMSAAIGSFTFYRVRTFDNALQVTGSARKLVTSDTVHWNATFTRTIAIESLKAGYADMKKDKDLVEKFFEEKQIGPKLVTFSPVFVEPNWGAPPDRQGREYILRQNVDVRSSDVQKITEIAKATEDLINKGVLFNTQMLEYTSSKLAELRVELLKDAMGDARARAESIAASDGRSVGTLKSAGIGVVQVLAPQSVAVEDYGAYDTSSIEKEVMVTVRATFRLE